MEQVHVVTGGFYGVGEVVGHSYHEKRRQTRRPSNIWHVLPVRDNQVCCLRETQMNYSVLHKIMLLCTDTLSVSFYFCLKIIYASR